MYTKIDHWNKEQDRLYNDYFPNRSETVFNQLMYEEIVEIPVEPEYSSSFGSYPNPFSETVSIYYELEKATQVQVDILDLSGRTISTLESRYRNKGVHVSTWDASQNGAGIYLFNIHTDGQNRMGKLVLVK